MHFPIGWRHSGFNRPASLRKRTPPIFPSVAIVRFVDASDFENQSEFRSRSCYVTMGKCIGNKMT